MLHRHHDIHFLTPFLIILDSALRISTDGYLKQSWDERVYVGRCIYSEFQSQPASYTFSCFSVFLCLVLLQPRENVLSNQLELNIGGARF